MQSNSAHSTSSLSSSDRQTGGHYSSALAPFPNQRGEREISVSWLPGTHRDSSLPHLSFPPLINDIVSLWQLYVIIGKRWQCEQALWFNYRRSHLRLISRAPVFCVALQTCVRTPWQKYQSQRRYPRSENFSKHAVQNSTTTVYPFCFKAPTCNIITSLFNIPFKRTVLCSRATVHCASLPITVSECFHSNGFPKE